MNLMTDRELQFYCDQCSARECCLDKEIDTDYEQEQERKRLELAKNTEREKEEHYFFMSKIEVVYEFY